MGTYLVAPGQAAALPVPQAAASVPAAAAPNEADASIGRRDRWRSTRRPGQADDGATADVPVAPRRRHRQLVALGLMVDLRV
jgi:hypothetical protein